MAIASREDAAQVTVSVDGVALGVFEGRTGGETDSAETAIQMGGMGPRRQLGGAPQVTNVVLTGLYDDARAGRAKWLRGRAGKGIATVTEVRLDTENNAIGDPQVWRGPLKRVKTPDMSSSSGTAGMLELEVSVDGSVG